MAVGDVVILDRLDTYVDFTGGMQPTFGLVAAEDAGPPVNSDVLWETGEFTSAVPQSELRKVFYSETAAPYIGQWVQFLGYPELEPPDPPDGSPKSPAFSGLVVRAFTTGDYDAAEPAAGRDRVVVAEGASARSFAAGEVGADRPFVVNQGRRAV